MKIIVYALALFSAFFVFSEESNLPYDPNDLRPPESKPWYYYECIGPNNSTYEIASETDSPKLCQPYWENFLQDTISAHKASGFYSSAGAIEWTAVNQWRYTFVPCRYGDCGTFGTDPETETNGQYYYIRLRVEWQHTCPNPMFPEHQFPVHKDPQPTNPETAPMDCAKLLDGQPEPDPEPDPDDNGCDEFGDNSFLPPKDSLGVPAGGSVCHTLADGTQCAYKKDPFGTGFEQTGQSCSADDTPYGEPELPPDDPNDPNACATVGSVEFFALCPVDPNETCNQIIINGDGGNMVHHDCPAGCGSINGQFVCAHEDKNANGIPDKDEQTDPDNPDPDNPDPDNPDPNNPDEGESADLTRTNTLLNGLDNKIGIGNSRLSDIKTGIDGMTNEQKKGNGSLAAIASNTAKTANNTKGTSENTAEILKSISETEVSNTFNPESSASFYESEYEEGFGGVWDEKSSQLQNTGVFRFLQQFKFNGGGSQPDMQICFNSTANLGCEVIPFDWTRILPFLKACILITAAFACRRIIFGG